VLLVLLVRLLVLPVLRIHVILSSCFLSFIRLFLRRLGCRRHELATERQQLDQLETAINDYCVRLVQVLPVLAPTP
jgi:hypothetical protein